jgi:hypothetical protein
MTASGGRYPQFDQPAGLFVERSAVLVDELAESLVLLVDFRKLLKSV